VEDAAGIDILPGRAYLFSPPGADNKEADSKNSEHGSKNDCDPTPNPLHSPAPTMRHLMQFKGFGRFRGGECLQNRVRSIGWSRILRDPRIRRTHGVILAISEGLLFNGHPCHAMRFRLTKDSLVILVTAVFLVWVVATAFAPIIFQVQVYHDKGQTLVTLDALAGVLALVGYIVMASCLPEKIRAQTEFQ